MNKICRICLEEGVLSSIFTKNFNISLCEMVEYCTNKKISRSDGLPDQMCSNCIYKLGIAYHFKQTCESADTRLRHYLGLPPPHKVSDAAIMTDPIVTPTATMKCKCKTEEPKKTSSNYKRKPESEKRKRGPKPRPRPVHACYHCQKQFRCQAQLDTHLRTHTGERPFACAVCPRRFAQKHNLTIHTRGHSGDRPFQCEVCSKRFAAQSNLSAHLKIHTGQRDHECSLCNKSFITSSELTRHMSKHRGLKNFKCELCGAAYIHARDLKLHKLKKHQIGRANSKMQNDNFNNSSNIDIIGIDVGKDVSPQNDHQMLHVVEKEPVVSLLSHSSDHTLAPTVPGTDTEHPAQSLPLPPTEHGSLLPYLKTEKEIYHQHYMNKSVTDTHHDLWRRF